MSVTKHTPRKSNRGVTGAVCIFLGFIIWIAFGQALKHEFVDYDDPYYVYNNPNITNGLTLSGIQWAFTHVHANNWHPLTSISHMMDCQLYGLQPWGHHLTNILLHAAAAILLFLALRQLTGSLWPSAFVAAIFAVHPLRVESVAWISERKDVLSGVFFMLTLWAYARYARTEQRSVGRYLIVLLFFALGLLCKPTLVTLPFVLLLLDYWPLGRWQKSEVRSRKSVVGGQSSVVSNQWSAVRSLVIEKIPLFVLSAASCAVTILAQKHVLAEMRELPFAERVGNAVVSYVAYLGQIIYPARLTVWYPYEHGNLHASQVIPAFLLLLIISVIFFLWRRNYPFLLMGWLWFLGMLVPMIGIIQVGEQPRADRYTYLPLIGLYVLATWGASELFAKWRRGREILVITALLIITALVTRSYCQTPYWRNTEVLWEHAIDSTSNNYVAHYHLANVLMKKGRLDDAIAQFQKVIQIQPSYAQAQNNLGIALADEGNFSEAMTAYQAALQARPDFVEAYNNLGILLATTGKPDEALNQFEEALRIDPNYIKTHVNLARLLDQLGRREEAMAHLNEALRLKANHADVSK
jgi:Flp pilus assembly protein TadD